MRKIAVAGELGWASPGTTYDIAPLELYYLRATVFEGRTNPRRATRTIYFLCVHGSFEADVNGKKVKVEEGELLEINQGEEYYNNARERAVVVVLEP
ncbi:MAG: hypothetical protein ACE5JA_00385 [bacterium]